MYRLNRESLPHQTARHRPGSARQRAPDECSVALPPVDVINDPKFPESALILPAALEMARPIAELKKRVKSAGIPAVYVNDNFGRRQSDFSRQVEHCLQDGMRGRPLAELPAPESAELNLQEIQRA